MMLQHQNSSKRVQSSEEKQRRFRSENR